MIHSVMWRLKDEAMGRSRHQNATLLVEKLHALLGLIPGLVDIETGIDVRRRVNSADVFFLGRFSSSYALENYHSHPAHEDIRVFASDIRIDSTIVDFESVVPSQTTTPN